MAGADPRVGIGDMIVMDKPRVFLYCQTRREVVRFQACPLALHGNIYMRSVTSSGWYPLSSNGLRNKAIKLRRASKRRPLYDAYKGSIDARRVVMRPRITPSTTLEPFVHLLSASSH